jgi:hypothetical protein
MKFHPVIRWMLGFSLFYLVLGFTLGSLLLFHKGIKLNPLIWSLRPAHIEFTLWGFITQLALGVGYGIFPRYRSRHPRGNPALHTVLVIMINAGIILHILGNWGLGPGWISLAGAAARTVGFGGFGITLWTRMRPYRV